MHVNPFQLLGGVLGGTLPNPTFKDEAGIAIAGQVFGKKPASYVWSNEAASVLGIETFLPHPPYIPSVRAGVNSSVTRDALGYVIDVNTDVLQTKVFSHDNRIPLAFLKAGANITLTQDALGYTIEAAGAASPTISTSTLTPVASQTIATNLCAYIAGFYEITGSLNLDLQGNCKFEIG